MPNPMTVTTKRLKEDTSQAVETAPDPTEVALDVALSALETFLDDTTSTTQRRAARDAVRTIRAKRTPARTP